jgi:hypothetical protein
MAESLSRLGNRRSEERSAPMPKEPAHVDNGVPEEDDHMHEAAEKMHEAEPGSKHMIVSHDGYSYKSHGIHEDGRHEPEEGAHDHENIEELKGHLGKFFDEEEEEGKHDDEEPEESQSLY